MQYDLPEIYNEILISRYTQDLQSPETKKPRPHIIAASPSSLAIPAQLSCTTIYNLSRRERGKTFGPHKRAPVAIVIIRKKGGTNDRASKFPVFLALSRKLVRPPHPPNCANNSRRQSSGYYTRVCVCVGRHGLGTSGGKSDEPPSRKLLFICSLRREEAGNFKSANFLIARASRRKNNGSPVPRARV